MSLHDKLRQAARNNADRREKIKQLNAKEQLAALVEKRITTVFIGALDRFEQKFGYLWGRDQKTLTPEQKKIMYLWKEVRTEILDHGHDQIKLLVQKELLDYNVRYQAKNISLPISKNYGENTGVQPINSVEMTEYTKQYRRANE